MKGPERQERGKAGGGGTRLCSEGPAEEVTRRPEPGCTYPYFLGVTQNWNLNSATAAGSSGSSTGQPRAALVPPCYFLSVRGRDVTHLCGDQLHSGSA